MTPENGGNYSHKKIQTKTFGRLIIIFATLNRSLAVSVERRCHGTLHTEINVIVNSACRQQFFE